MTLEISQDILRQIHAHGEAVYPEEGAGFLLGDLLSEDRRRVTDVLPVENARESGARHNRYAIPAKTVLEAEQAAEARSLTLLGVFHSHPDHPSRPSDYDREWALPWLSYLITRVEEGGAVESRAWRLADDRVSFVEEAIVIHADLPRTPEPPSRSLQPD